MVVKTQKLFKISDGYNVTITHDKANLITICVPNVVYYCKWFTISVLINPSCDSGAAKYRCQTGSLIYLQFYICIKKTLFFKYQVFPELLISTTISRRPVNFINLYAIIVAFCLWPAEYDSKLRRNFQIKISEVTLDVFKILSKNEYCEYCCKPLQNIFEYINAHSVKISSKSESWKL